MKSFEICDSDKESLLEKQIHFHAVPQPEWKRPSSIVKLLPYNSMIPIIRSFKINTKFKLKFRKDNKEKLFSSSSNPPHPECHRSPPPTAIFYKKENQKPPLSPLAPIETIVILNATFESFFNLSLEINYKLSVS